MKKTADDAMPKNTGAADRLPLVTIITPAYNRASYLDETILSVLQQDYPCIEYLVLDDGSRDGTVELLKNYSDRLTWTSHPNMGETRTVNKGFSLARGEIIGVVNSDDPLRPGAVAKIVNCFLQDPELLVVYPDWDMIDGEGATVQSVATFPYSYADMIRWHHCMPGPGTFFRKEVVERTGGRDPQFRFVADFDFWLRAGLLGKFARIPERLATFRVHDDSASVLHQGKAMAHEHVRLTDKLFALPGLPSELRRLKREAYSSTYYVAGCVCGSASALARKSYFLAAAGLAPLKYIGEYRERTFYMFPAVMRTLFFCFGWVARVLRKQKTARKGADL